MHKIKKINGYYDFQLMFNLIPKISFTQTQIGVQHAGNVTSTGRTR